MTLSTAAKRYSQAGIRPVGYAVDAGTGGVRGQLYFLDTGEWIGDEPITNSYQTTQSAHNPPHITMSTADGESAFRTNLQMLRERDAGELKGSKLVAIAVDGHMHALAFIEHDGSVIQPMHMWNSAAAAEFGNVLRELTGWNVPDRVGVSHLLRVLRANPDAFASQRPQPTTMAGLIGYRLTGKHGLDYCEHSGMGTLDPHTGENSPAFDETFGFAVGDLFPARLAPNQVLGQVNRAGELWLGDDSGWALEAIVAAPFGDQGAGRDGLGCRLEHAGCIVGTSVVTSTETIARPSGFGWVKGADNAPFDPFMSPHGRFFNMGLHANGMRTADPFKEQLLATPEFDSNEVLFFETLGREAEADAPDLGGDFGVSFLVADPSLGVKKAHTVEFPPGTPRGRIWHALFVQQALSIRKRAFSLNGGEMPKLFILGGAAARDDYFAQALADGTGIPFLRPENGAKASLVGMRARGRLAEELASGNSEVDPIEFMYEEVPAPSAETGRLFTPRAERTRALMTFSARFDDAIRATGD